MTKGAAYGEEQEKSRSGAQRREDTPERSQRAQEKQEVKPPPVVVQLEVLEMKGESQ